MKKIISFFLLTSFCYNLYNSDLKWVSEAKSYKNEKTGYYYKISKYLTFESDVTEVFGNINSMKIYNFFKIKKHEIVDYFQIIKYKNKTYYKSNEKITNEDKSHLEKIVDKKFLKKTVNKPNKKKDL